MVAISAVSASAQPAISAEPTIMLYGDSLMAGLGLPADEGFMAQLQAALDARGVNVTLVNASVSGDTTAAGLQRLDWSLGEAPDAVMLGLGANDMLQGLPAEQARANLDAIMAQLDARDLPVLLLGMKASPSLGADYVQRFDGIYPALAAQYDALLYPFFLEGVALDATLNQADVKHPNAQGVARIVAGLVPIVEQLVARIDPASP